VRNDDTLLAGSWDPDGWRGAVSITFGNLGEAGEIAAGVWPTDKPLGQHSSVTNLPTVLSVLEAGGWGMARTVRVRRPILTGAA
jgi:hypothetical protein